jgi:hypothetical protein
MISDDKAREFISTVASLTYEGESRDGELYEMESVDAVLTLSTLILEARKLLS